jgi:hypothetical protein
VFLSGEREIPRNPKLPRRGSRSCDVLPFARLPRQRNSSIFASGEGVVVPRTSLVSLTVPNIGFRDRPYQAGGGSSLTIARSCGGFDRTI